MNLARFAVENRAFAYFATLIVILAGIGSFFALGQLEDPEFAVKNVSRKIRVGSPGSHTAGVGRLTRHGRVTFHKVYG